MGAVDRRTSRNKLSLIVLAVLFLAGCNAQAPMDVVRNGICLTTADVFHDRLNEECARVGCAALYQGALAYPASEGARQIFHSGRWIFVPLKRVLAQETARSKLLRQEEVLALLQVSPVSSKESIVITVGGENFAVYIRGVPVDWCFPGTHTTILALVESCSDPAVSRNH